MKLKSKKLTNHSQSSILFTVDCDWSISYSYSFIHCCYCYCRRRSSLLTFTSWFHLKWRRGPSQVSLCYKQGLKLSFSLFKAIKEKEKKIVLSFT